MTLNDYQKQAMTTCMQSSNNFSYMMLNLVGEVGEFASKVAKAIRKEEVHIGDEPVEGEDPLWHRNRLFENIDDPRDIAAARTGTPTHFDLELQKEAGDILWQLSGLCSVMGWSLEDIARQNLDKLASRQKRNVIDGNGDNR